MILIKKLILFFFLSATSLFSESLFSSNKFDFQISSVIILKTPKCNNILSDYEYYKYDTNYNSMIKFQYYDDLGKYKNSGKEENLFRRAEILFFGSLTFATFGGWFFFSVFNAMIYNEPFGKLRREQFLPLYLGSSVISISVVLSDLFINLRPKIKNVEIY